MLYRYGILALSLLIPPATYAQTYFTPDRLGANDRFGMELAASGDYAIVAATDDDDGGHNAGAAYLFERVGGTWTEAFKFALDRGEGRQLWGAPEVAIDGPYAVAAGYRQTDSTGVAYVLERTAGGWAYAATLVPEDPVANNLFGIRVSISGSRIIAQARGGIYVFDRVGTAWEQTAKIPRSGRADVDGDRIAIATSGMIYVYEMQGGIWMEAGTVEHVNYEGRPLGASDVDLEGDRIVVGHATFRHNRGIVAYYTRDAGGTWRAADRFHSPLEVRSEHFGVDVDLEGDRLLIANTGNWRYFRGGIYLYELEDGATSGPAWRLVGQDPADLGYVSAAAIAGGEVLVGLPMYGVSAGTGAVRHQAGAVRVYDFESTGIPPMDDRWVPDCEYVALEDGPPPSATLRVRDYYAGLASLEIVKRDNVQVSWPAFAPGTTAPVDVLIEQIRADRNAGVTIRATDTAGNTDTCRPRIGLHEPPALLAGNAPNPFNPSTRISFSVNEAGPVRIAVYDVLGREVARIVDEPLETGAYDVVFDARNLPSGMYVYRLQAGGYVESRPMVLAK